jgi:type VI secretion system protein ImpI
MLRLSIENLDRLPDGGPLRVEVKGRGLDFGRDAHLDWTLPDASRTVSSKHCEVRFRDGGYWLHDVSTNGTFVNGSPHRLDVPYLLRDGDRLNVGPYIIAVSVESGRDAGRSQPAAAGAPLAANVWDPAETAAAPDDRAAYQIHKAQARSPDFLDSAAFIEPANTRVAQAPPPIADAWLVPAAAAPPQPGVAAHTPPSRRRPAPPPLRVEASGGVAISPVTAQSQAAPDDATLIHRIALAAGIPEHAITGRDPNALAEEIGLVVRLTVQNLAQMLSSRAESKTLMRSSSRTMVRAIENNPLKFTDSIEEALSIMFGRPTRQYLDARATIENSFSDLKTHQVLTCCAIRDALDTLFEELAPDRIDRSVNPDHGLGRILAARKARLWDIYVDRWRAKTKRADGRLLDAFLALFAEAYDRLQLKSK